MFDKLKKLFVGSDEPKLPHEELLERLEADKKRISAAECSERNCGRKIESAILMAFRKRVRDRLGHDPFSATTIKTEAADYAFARAADKRTEIKRKQKGRIDDLARSEGFQSEFASLDDLEHAVLERRVIAIATREDLDITLATKKSLNSALMEKHAEAIRVELIERKRQKR